MYSVLSSLKLFLRGLQGYFCSFSDGYIDCGLPDKIIGSSVEGRNIELYTFGSGGKKLLYIGGMHGNEVGTTKCMQHWIRCIQDTPEVIPEDISICVIPCMNPDAYEIAKKYPDRWKGGRFKKVNANGVDLNRNFPTSNRSSDATRFLANVSSHISGGTYPGSEPETKAVLDLIEKEEISTIYVYHNRRGTVMSSFDTDADIRAIRYCDKSGYRLFTSTERDNRGDEKKTGHFTIRAQENDISLIEVEMTTRWLSERGKNKIALLDSLYL